MKKYLFIFSAAILALAACNKEIEIDNPVNNGPKVSALTFTSARPQLDADTKTSWDGSAIVWTATDDKIKVGFTFEGAWWGQTAAYSSSAESPNNHKKFYQSDAVDIDATDASVGTFSVPATFTVPSDNGAFEFYAVYPATALNNDQDNAPTVSVTLKSTQTPLANSFDGSADLMVGKSAEINSTGLPSDPIDLDWTRVVAHGLFTLKDFQNVVSGESIEKVVFTAQDGANLTGKQSVNIADGTVTATEASNVITLDGANLAFVTEEAKTNLKVWLSVVPGTLTALNVLVETNKATYTRNITGISKTLKGNACNKLGINMHDATRTPKAEYDWVKKDLSEITSSDIFVIVGNNGSNYAMSNDNGTSSAPSAVAVTVSNNKLSSAPAEKLQWNLSVSSGSYTFYPNGTTETWLYCTNTNNGVRVGDSASKVFTIDGGYLKNTATSRYVGVYNSQDWRCYTTNTGTSNIKDQTFAFYVRTTAGPAVTWNLESIAITTEPTKTVYTEGQSFDPAGMVVTGHFVDADDNTNTKDEAVTGYTITPDGALSTSDDHVTITYQGKTTTQAITVNAPSYDFETIAELNTLVTSSGDNTKNNDAVEYSGKLTGAVVSFVPNANNAIIKDATGSILVYKNDHGLLQGQTFSGEVSVSAKLYYTTVEITAINASFTGSQTEVLPVTMTLSQLEGNFSTYQNAYVKVEGLTITAKDGKNISVSDGSKTYLVYDNANSSTAGVGDVITAVGTVADHNGTNQIKVWASSDIAVTGSAPKAITFTQPTGGAGTAGCSFTVSVGGSPITSGETVASGTTVTLTATAGTDYEFTSWTVTGATVADASAATTTFTMENSPVTVSASFTSTGGGNTSASYTYEFESQQFSATGSKTLNSVSWTLSGTPNYYGFDGNGRGQQFGSKNNPATNAILTTSGISGTISTVKVSAAAYSSSATLTVSVGGTVWDTVNLTSTNAEYTFTGTPTTGTVVITLTNPATGGRALYIKKIVVQ